MKREFFLQDDKSNKFWTVEVTGCLVITTNGRVGATPRETRKEFATHADAFAAAEKQVLEKQRKGYGEGRVDQIPAYRERLPPKLISIDHDDYHAAFVGRTSGGDQFFLTYPFAPATGDDPGGTYIALYVFDQFGALKEAKIHRSKPTATEEDAFAKSLLDELGKIRFCRIKVAPFSVEAFGRQFGLIFDPGDEGDDEEDVCVTAEPGDYMAFYPPWDGGYDT